MKDTAQRPAPPTPLRIFHLEADQFSELSTLPEAMPAQGFLWLGVARDELEPQLAALQSALQRWTGGALVDLHVSDLLNVQLPSHFDYTSWYDLLVFRRLVTPAGRAADAERPAHADGARQLLQTVDTQPVGMAVFDRVLLSVHPADCLVREHFARRLVGLAAGGSGVLSADDGSAAPEPAPRPFNSELRSSRLPTNPADLMLRMTNHMVDSYLELRRQLSRQLGWLQQALMDPRSRFSDWAVLLESRNALVLLEDICEDQRSAVQEWIDALDEAPAEPLPQAQRERDLLRVRSRDVLEHVERVLGHVRRLEQSAEAAVQMHFSALGHRTNDIMRTLTVLTAVFLPLNLITGFFGMNFDGLPLIHSRIGLWVAVACMAAVGLGLLGYFWRMRYLGRAKK